MAKKASAESVAADMSPPNYRGAVQIIRGAIVKKKEKIQGINSEIGDQWGKVEGFKVNKKAGQIFATLDKLEHSDRMEIMRSLNGLMDAAGWEEDDSDLVDDMEDNVVHLRLGKPAVTEGGEDELNEQGEDPAIADLCDAITDNPKPIDGLTDEIIAKAAAKKAALNAAAAKPVTEKFTGDNSDLAGE